MTASANTSESSVIRIDDKQSAGRSILNLAQVLEMLPPSAAALVWAVQDLSVSGVSRPGLDVHELEAQTKRAPSGLVLSWVDLLALARRLTQVQEGVIIGSQDRDHMPPVGAESAVLANYPVVLEAVDSSYWLVHAVDPNLRLLLAKAFANVRAASVSDL